MKEWIISAIEDEPGIWTARLCRRLNRRRQDEEGIIYCGQCAHYANPRKRERAKRFSVSTLPGLEPPYQLHPPCCGITLWQLQGRLRVLSKQEEPCVVGLPKRPIPDVRQPRGWDYATRWFPADSYEWYIELSSEE